MTDPIPKHKRADVQKWASGLRSAGESEVTILAAAQRKYPGVTLADLFPPPAPPVGRGVARSLGQGITLGHLDEARGALATPRKAGRMLGALSAGPMGIPAAVASGGAMALDPAYQEARDAVRAEDAAFANEHPIIDFLARATGAAAPAVALSMMPGATPVVGAGLLANFGRLAGVGAIEGAIQGEGESSKELFSDTPRGVTLDAGVGTLLGAGGTVLGGVVASGFARRAAARGAAGQAAQNELLGMIEPIGARSPRRPFGNVDPSIILRQQEKLAPGTGVVADVAPNAQALLADIGADPATAHKALAETRPRLHMLKSKKDAVGKFYDTLRGVRAPITPPLRRALMDAANEMGRASKELKSLQLDDIDLSGIIKGADADLYEVWRVRSLIEGNARRLLRSKPALARQLDGVADQMTDAIEVRAPNIRQADFDYAVLTDRIESSLATRDAIEKSIKKWGGQRVFHPGNEAGVVEEGTTLMRARPQGVGLTMVFPFHRRPTHGPADGARAVYDYLLNPKNAQNVLSRVQLAQFFGQTFPQATWPAVGAAGAITGASTQPAVRQPQPSARRPGQ